MKTRLAFGKITGISFLVYMLMFTASYQTVYAQEGSLDTKDHKETRPSGSVSISASSQTIYVGQSVTFTASVDPAYHSDGHGGCIEDSPSVSISVGGTTYNSSTTPAITATAADIQNGITATASVSGQGTYDPSSDDVTVTVKPPKVTEVSLKSGHFPKCQGDQVSLNDFNYNTVPHSYINDVEIKTFSPDMSATTGSHTATLWISGMDGSGKSVEYDVIAAGNTHCEDLHPKQVNDSFSNVECIRMYPPSPPDVYPSYYKYKGSGNIQGNGAFQSVYTTAWSPCSGNVDVGKVVSVGYGGTIGYIWEGAQAQISFSYSTATSVTIHGKSQQGKRIRLEAMQQPITLTSTLHCTNRNIGIGSPIGITWVGWQPDNETITQSQSGYAIPVVRECIKCCS